jgi:hypothetical protein
MVFLLVGDYLLALVCFPLQATLNILVLSQDMILVCHQAIHAIQLEFAVRASLASISKLVRS